MRWWFAAVLVMAASPAPGAERDASLAALQATVRLHGGGHSGTGFLVAIPAEAATAAHLLLVSAAHTFADIKGPEATAVCREADGKGGFRRREVMIPIAEGDRPLWVRHPEADVAVLSCTLPAGVDRTAFPLGRLATAADFDGGRVRVGEPVRVACYPAQTEANAAGWPVLRTGAIASHPLSPAAALERFFTDYAHFGGDSGAAVVLDDGGSGLVIGVVVAMQRQTDRITSPYEEKTIHTPLGLAITVPSTLVRETIERWRQQPADAGPGR